jgi:hypothetical protein
VRAPLRPSSPGVSDESASGRVKTWIPVSVLTQMLRSAGIGEDPGGVLDPVELSDSATGAVGIDLDGSIARTSRPSTSLSSASPARVTHVGRKSGREVRQALGPAHAEAVGRFACQLGGP